jgi:hypothetical protein
VDALCGRKDPAQRHGGHPVHHRQHRAGQGRRLHPRQLRGPA